MTRGRGAEGRTTGPAGRRNRMARLATWGTGVGVGTIALMMALSSVAAATTIVAPYHGKIEQFGGTTFNGCFSLKNPVKSHLSLKTGIANFKAAGSAKNCPGPLGKTFWSGADITGSTNALIHLKIGGGPHSVGVSALAKGKIAASIVPSPPSGVCPATVYSYVNTANGSYDYNQSFGECFVEAEAQMFAEPLLYDATNATWLYPTTIPVYNLTLVENFTLIDWICYGPGYNYTPACKNYNSSSSFAETETGVVAGSLALSENVSASGTSYFNSTFVGTHSYYLVWETEGVIVTETFLAPGASAAASVDYGSPGYGIDLSSISIV